MNWVKTLNQAIDYIEDHLLDDITITQIADHVYIGGAHLQRGFSALAGLTIGEYIRNRRLSLAGLELTRGDVRVIDIAVKYGYETAESFSKAFRRFHGISPSKAKQDCKNLKSYSRLTVKIIMEGGSVMEYRIEQREAFEVVVKMKTIEVEEGNSTQIPAFWDEYLAANLPKPTLGICGEVAADTNTFRYGIGDFKKKGQEVLEGFEILQVPQGTWAVFTSKVGVEHVQAMWNRIYSEWLPQAQYTLLPSYDFEYYRNINGSATDDTGKMTGDLVCEIWLPVEKKEFS